MKTLNVEWRPDPAAEIALNIGARAKTVPSRTSQQRQGATKKIVITEHGAVLHQSLWHVASATARIRLSP